mmetsp:Transcript_18747/g.27767  ORF Transcript_18747/g.27767 Transcript_18747/m.27767 type:complete len:193 (-) Transcript_18747:116-694(-)|eukprot:CAMPEP_0194047870 /NCGR_PEP_ID=MMETSP0009_2-20130614/25902_1 /TAXON_ID=210454 /ORGANISM="Grammatophora oceanica, Strain CCMP 410" /LENGTH=192 /DNA_ID=CAMNT_0038693601 /DNA_START=125 /DNA_END=703 /DNA_ORIENTATION=+
MANNDYQKLNASSTTTSSNGRPSATSPSSSAGNLKAIMALLIGILLGHLFSTNIASSSSDYLRNLGPRKGKVVELADVPFRNTSHIDDEGRPIVKQQLVEPFAVPNFVGVSIASFEPGQTMMPVHEHNSLHEFFYVVEGTGVIQKDGVDHDVKPGTFLHMAPHEKHGIWIPKDSKDGTMKMLVCGVTVGPKD